VLAGQERLAPAAVGEPVEVPDQDLVELGVVEMRLNPLCPVARDVVVPDGSGRTCGHNLHDAVPETDTVRPLSDRSTIALVPVREPVGRAGERPRPRAGAPSWRDPIPTDRPTRPAALDEPGGPGAASTTLDPSS